MTENPDPAPGRLPVAGKAGRVVLLLLCLLPWPTALIAGGGTADRMDLSPPRPTQMPGLDRLAVPVLPESPTQVDTGRYLYYFHCMPCHGDRGQGLTDEWRQVWDEEHRNCWGRGCHAARSEMDAFFLPRSVPPLIGLGSFETADDLFTFLRETQPPQRPGTLSDPDYWALTAFLLYENGRLPAGAQVGPQPAGHSGRTGIVALAILLFLPATLLVLWLVKGRGAHERQSG